ncbi:unnamed protein product [Choristocarpus tenellus]
MSEEDQVVVRLLYLLQRAGAPLDPNLAKWGSATATSNTSETHPLFLTKGGGGGQGGAGSGLRQKWEWLIAAFDPRRLKFSLEMFPIDRPVDPPPTSYETCGTELNQATEVVGEGDEEVEVVHEGEEGEYEMGTRQMLGTGWSTQELDGDIGDQGKGEDCDTHLELASVGRMRKEEVYDPSFVLPLVDWALRVAGAPAQAVCQRGLLGYLLMATSSLCKSTRTVGYSCLQQILNSLMQDKKQTDSRFNQRPQLALLLRCLRDSLDVPFQRVPCVVAVLLARASEVVMSTPGSDVYKAVNNFLLRRPCIRLRELPMFNSLFTGVHGSGGGIGAGSGASGLTAASHLDPASAGKARLWLLRGLRDGLRTSQDLGIVARERAIPLLLAMADSPAGDGDTALMGLVLDIVCRLASLEQSGTRYLLNTIGIVAWCRLVLGRDLPSTSSALGQRVGGGGGEHELESKSLSLPPEMQIVVLQLLRTLLHLGLKLKDPPVLLVQEFALLTPDVIQCCCSRVRVRAGSGVGAQIVTEGLALLVDVHRAMRSGCREEYSFWQSAIKKPAIESGMEVEEGGERVCGSKTGWSDVWGQEGEGLDLSIREALSLSLAVEAVGGVSAPSPEESINLRWKLLGLLSSPGVLAVRRTDVFGEEIDGMSRVLDREVEAAEGLIRWCIKAANTKFRSATAHNSHNSLKIGTMRKNSKQKSHMVDADTIAARGALWVVERLLTGVGDQMGQAPAVAPGIANALRAYPSVTLSILGLANPCSMGRAPLCRMAVSIALALSRCELPPCSKSSDQNSVRLDEGKKHEVGDVMGHADADDVLHTPSSLLLALSPSLQKMVANPTTICLHQIVEDVGTMTGREAASMKPLPSSVGSSYWLSLTAASLLTEVMTEDPAGVAPLCSVNRVQGDTSKQLLGVEDAASGAWRLLVSVLPQGLEEDSDLKAFADLVRDVVCSTGRNGNGCDSADGIDKRGEGEKDTGHVVLDKEKDEPMPGSPIAIAKSCDKKQAMGRTGRRSSGKKRSRGVGRDKAKKRRKSFFDSFVD